MARVKGDKAINIIVSGLDGVRDATFRTAKVIGHRAETRLLAHRDTGAAEIDVTRGDVDAFVSLVDEAALSIEFGHIHNRSGEFIPGLYIVLGAADLA